MFPSPHRLSMRTLALLFLLSPLWLMATMAHAVTVIAADVPPFVIRSQQGAPSGMAIEVLEEAARRLHEPLTIEMMPLARALIQTRHRPDVLLLPPVRSPQRASQLLWIVPLLEEAFVLVSDQRHHADPLFVKTLSALTPAPTIGAMRGSYGESLIQPIPGIQVERVAEEISNASKLARGRIQGWAVAWNSARYNQQQAGLPLANLVRGQTLQRTAIYLAAHPDFSPAEATRWRKTIQGMRRDGSLARILKQYDYQAP
nr:transporter substrate-binding domain-containing protein [Aeromonas tecta]